MIASNDLDDSRAASEANAKALARLLALIRSAQAASMRRGSHGRVVLEIAVQDGTWVATAAEWRQTTRRGNPETTETTRLALPPD
jgi:hypothetical protein